MSPAATRRVLAFPVPRTAMPRYILDKRIGDGGMAEVFQAHIEGPEGFRRVCAVKRLLPELRRDRGLQNRFIDEARITGRLQHPCIVHVFDFYEEDGVHHLVMELVEGASAEELILRSVAGAFVPVAVSATIILETARALQYAHSQQVLHRDVSPCNVLIAAAGDIKLADFGLADAVGRLSSTEPGTIAGKIAYMSPARRQGRAATADDDLYSLGIMLERLLQAADPRQRATAVGRGLAGLQGRLVSSAPAVEWPALIDSLRRLGPATPETVGTHVRQVTTAGQRVVRPAGPSDQLEGATLTRLPLRPS